MKILRSTASVKNDSIPTYTKDTSTASHLIVRLKIIHLNFFFFYVCTIIRRFKNKIIVTEQASFMNHSRSNELLQSNLNAPWFTNNKAL